MKVNRFVRSVSFTLVCCFFLSVALFFGGCSDSGESGSEKVRLLHAAPTVGPINVFFDGERIVEGLRYGQFTTYFEGPEGTAAVRILEEGQIVALIDREQSFTSASDQSLFLILDGGTPTLQMNADTNTAPNSGQFRLRIGNFAPSLETVEVYITAPEAEISSSTPVVTGLAFKSFSTYLAIDAGTYRIRYTTAGGARILRDTGALEFTEGTVFTHLVLEDDEGGAPYISRLITDIGPQ